MNDGLRVRVLTGADPALPAFVPDLARLRIAVFRDFPYLYDGTLAYEERYISTYLECPESLFVLARGRGPYEATNYIERVAAVMKERSIPHRVEIWGKDADHDWPTWRTMLPLFLSKLV